MQAASIRHRMEYVTLRVIMGIFGRLPETASFALARAGARILVRPASARLEEAVRRMQEVFPKMDKPRARAVALQAWENLFCNAAEVAQGRRLTRDWITKHVAAEEGLEKLQGLLRGHGGLIVAVPHLGNWELAGLGLSILGFPALTISRTQKNRLVADYLQWLRTQHGLQCLDRDDPGLLRKILRHLRSGGILALLPDVRARTDAVTVDFLGAPSMVPRGLATVALTAGCPVLPACAIREGHHRHRWDALEPVFPATSAPRDDAAEELTQRVFLQFDQMIRQYPEQYFWFNRRWIHDPL